MYIESHDAEVAAARYDLAIFGYLQGGSIAHYQRALARALARLAAHHAHIGGVGDGITRVQVSAEAEDAHDRARAAAPR